MKGQTGPGSAGLVFMVKYHNMERGNRMNILKKNLSLFLVCCMTLVFLPFMGIAASADEGETNPRIYVDGQKIETDVDPYIANDRTMVPVALIVNYLGGKSEWDGATQSVVLRYGTTVIKMRIGSVTATVNGVAKTLDVAPSLRVVKTGGDGARTMVPLRFVGESFGFTVGWDGDSTTVYVETGIGSGEDVTTVRSVYLFANQAYGGRMYTYITVNADKSLKDAMILQHSLTDPYRFYIDFDHTAFLEGIPMKQTQNVAASHVTGVRLGDLGDGTARLVVDLDEMQQPKVSFSDTGKEMTLSFLENNSSGGQTVTPVTPQPEPTVGDHDTLTVTGTVKHDTISNYAPHADGRLVVCIDPGHGATTGGKCSFDRTLLEWEFNRSVAYKLKSILESRGIECVMTVAQNDQRDPSLAERVAVANNHGRVDLFVSVHANAYGNSWNSASGWEVYAYQSGGVSEMAAKCVEDAKKAAIPELRERGFYTSDFYVIKNTEMPAILVEHGFYTNIKEVEYLKSDDFRNRLAQADADGIVNFFNSFA